MGNDLYSVNAATQTLNTSTCQLLGNATLNTKGPVAFEVVVADLCRCMLLAIAQDDSLGKQAIGGALLIILNHLLVPGSTE